jgi:hypothetical protein
VVVPSLVSLIECRADALNLGDVTTRDLADAYPPFEIKAISIMRPTITSDMAIKIAS